MCSPESRILPLPSPKANSKLCQLLSANTGLQLTLGGLPAGLMWDQLTFQGTQQTWINKTDQETQLKEIWTLIIKIM